QLDAKQYGTLLLVNEKPYSSQKEIAEIQKVDRTTMVGYVDLLESLEYVQRTKNPDDRRSYCLVMTEKGKEVLAACSGFLEETELQVLSALNKEEQRLLKQLLSKIWASLNHDEGGL
ncbi:MAG TPA: MarR family transcriptional regulator, partial [Bacillales bacterium]